MPSTSRFFWYELMTTDVAAAQRFYEPVVGWAGQSWCGASGTESTGYTILNAGEQGVAGIMDLPEEVRQVGGRPGWLGYVHTPDVDAAAARIQAAGGALHRPPSDIPEIGRFAVVADPHGAVFMLMTPQGPDQPPPSPMTPGHVGWHELYAGDGPSAFDFYAGQFGWTKADALDMGPMGVYQLFAAGGETIGGMMTKPPGMPSPAWLFYFTVPAIDAAAARVSEHGGQVVQGPMEVPGGAWIIQAQDPQGAMFALVAPRR